MNFKQNSTSTISLPLAKMLRVRAYDCVRVTLVQLASEVMLD